jgi:hypothetical protein
MVGTEKEEEIKKEAMTQTAVNIGKEEDYGSEGKL